MAFVHDYSDAKKNLGRWYSLGLDEEKRVYISLRIRRLARDERKRLEKPHLRSRKQKRGGRTLEIPPALMENFGIDCALWMWTDVRNGYITANDEEGVKFYSRELNMEVKIGDEIRIDGKLTDDIKLRLIDQDNSIASFITDKGILIDEESAEEDKKEAEKEEVATENLSNG